MGQSLSKISLHIIFSTKRREPCLWDAAFRDELCAYVATVLRGLECPASIINGVADHLHILCQLSRKLAVMDLVKDAKTSTVVDQETIRGLAPFCLAKWLWRVFGERVERARGASVHR